MGTRATVVVLLDIPLFGSESAPRAEEEHRPSRIAMSQLFSGRGDGLNSFPSKCQAIRYPYLPRLNVVLELRACLRV
jgi:hypothetical protein